MLAGSILDILKPWPLAFIVDCVLDHKPPPHWFGPGAVFNHAALLAGLSTALLVVYFLHGAVVAAQDYLPAEARLHWLTRLQNKLFALLRRLSPRIQPVARESEIWPVQTLGNCLGALLSIAVMFWMNIYLTLLALALVPFAALTIKSFGAKQAGNRSWELAYRLSIALIFALGAAAITWVGAVQVAARHLTTGELLVFLAYLVRNFEPFRKPFIADSTAKDLPQTPQR